MNDHETRITETPCGETISQPYLPAEFLDMAADAIAEGILLGLAAVYGLDPSADK